MTQITKNRKQELRNHIWSEWHAFCNYKAGMKVVNKYTGFERAYALGYLDGLDIMSKETKNE
jgi:hypothetical protein